MFHVSIYANVLPRTDRPLTSICTCTCIVDAQEARLSRRERERRNGALESAEEKHGWRGAE